MNKVTEQLINNLKNFKGKVTSHWVPRNGNQVGYWEYSFGMLTIQDSLCLHILYDNEKIECFHMDDKNYDLIAKALREARDRQKENAVNKLLNGEL